MQRSKLGMRNGSFFFNVRYTDILKLKCRVKNLLQFSQLKIY